MLEELCNLKDEIAALKSEIDWRLAEERKCTGEERREITRIITITRQLLLKRERQHLQAQARAATTGAL